LLEARKPNCYRYDAAELEQFVDQIVSFFCTAQDVTEEEPKFAFQDAYSDKSPKRCGIPRTQDYFQDQPFMFLDNLHNRQDQRCSEITSFFIRRSVFWAFFGDRRLSEQPLLVPDRLEQDSIGRRRIEQERLEQEKLEQEKLEQEKLEQERLEQARLDQEELAKINKGEVGQMSPDVQGHDLVRPLNQERISTSPSRDLEQRCTHVEVGGLLGSGTKEPEDSQELQSETKRDPVSSKPNNFHRCRPHVRSCCSCIHR
jgi:hypothetical protein